MAQSISFPTPLNRHLRVVRSEDPPPYDDVPVKPRSPSDVLLSLGEVVGASAGFLYVMLDQHAEDGRCSLTVDRLAALTGLSDRWVREGLRRLETSGFIVVTKQTNRFGAQLPNTYELPLHPRTYRDEVPPELNMSKTSPPLYNSNTESPGIISTSVETGELVHEQNVVFGGSKKSKPKSRPTTIPENLFELIPPETCSKLGIEQRLSLDQLRYETVLMIDYWQAKGEQRPDWVASWRSWMRSKYRQTPSGPIKVNGLAIDELLRMDAEGQWLPDEYKERVNAYKNGR